MMQMQRSIAIALFACSVFVLFGNCGETKTGTEQATKENATKLDGSNEEKTKVPERSGEEDNTIEALQETTTEKVGPTPERETEIDPSEDKNCGQAYSFKMDVFPILQRCSCHSGPGAHDPPYFTTAQETYPKLVNKKSRGKGCEARLIVKPGDIEDSYLIHKLEGQSRICGNKMPPRGTLSATQLQIIKSWICHGAKNN